MDSVFTAAAWADAPRRDAGVLGAGSEGPAAFRAVDQRSLIGGESKRCAFLSAQVRRDWSDFAGVPG
jgi:hypothetical protein